MERVINTRTGSKNSQLFILWKMENQMMFSAHSAILYPEMKIIQTFMVTEMYRA